MPLPFLEDLKRPLISPTLRACRSFLIFNLNPILVKF